MWHDERKTNAQFEKEEEEEEKMDGMKALENRVLESQREMAELDALEEIRAMNARHVKMMGKRGELDAAQAVLDAREANLGIGQNKDEDEELNENGLTNDEEELVKSIKFGRAIPSNELSVIHRLDEQDEILAEKKRKEEAEALILNKRKIHNEKPNKSSLPFLKVKRKKRKDADNGDTKRTKIIIQDNEKEATREEPTKPDSSGGALGGLLGYGSSSDSD